MTEEESTSPSAVGDSSTAEQNVAELTDARPALRIAVVTLFPELLQAFAETSVVGRGRRAGLVQFHFEDLRKHGVGKYQSVDDTPYGGGSGMVLRVDCVVPAIEAAEKALGGDERPQRILMTPQGKPFNQKAALQLAQGGAMILVCGRYEGFDSRVSKYVDAEISLGDFVLAGGEIAAMAIAEASVRLVPGVLGNSNSVEVESFSVQTGGILEFPQYTRPQAFRGHEVPDVLRGGNHAVIEAWRQQQAVEQTARVRPDLVKNSDRK